MQFVSYRRSSVITADAIVYVFEAGEHIANVINTPLRQTGLIFGTGVANLEHGEECLLRDIHAAHALHPLLAFLLLLEQLAFAAEISPP